MPKTEIIANCGREEVRIALIEDGKLAEFFWERARQFGQRGEAMLTRWLEVSLEVGVSVGLNRDLEPRGFRFVPRHFPTVRLGHLLIGVCRYRVT